MDTQYVQGIILKEDKVLYAHCSNKDTLPAQFFFRGIIAEDETALEAIRREIKEQLNLSPEITFQLKQEYLGNVTTFFIDMANLDVELENNNSGFTWISLDQINRFSTNDYLYLMEVFRQCIAEKHNCSSEAALEKFVNTNNDYKYTISSILNKKRREKERRLDEQATSLQKLLTIAGALALGIIFRIFFKGYSLGVNHIIFTLLFFGFFFLTTKQKINPRNIIGWFMLMAAFLLSINFSIHSNIFLTLLNFMLMPIFTVAATLLLCCDNMKWERLSFIKLMLRKVIITTFENAFKPFSFMKKIILTKGSAEISSTKKNIIRGLVISIPLLIVIFALLSSADMVFNFYVTEVFSIFNHLTSAWSFIGDLIFILCTALYIFGYVWSFKYPYDHSRERKTRVRTIEWEPITMLTIIFIINLVYLAFSIIQFSYLYCGGVSSLPNGYSFSTYAREGFFELVAITVLNFVIIISSMKFMSKSNKTLNKIAKISLSFLVVFTLNMLFSAHYKMSLYETAFGFTYLRVFVHLFMVLLLMLLIIAFAAIWFNKIPVGKASIIVTVIMYLVINYINVDTFIAKKNIEIYKKTNKIDIYYLTSLSYDALPEIITLENDKNPQVANQVKLYIENSKLELSRENSWLEYNYSKEKAEELLNIK